MLTDSKRLCFDLRKAVYMNIEPIQVSLYLFWDNDSLY